MVNCTNSVQRPLPSLALVPQRVRTELFAGTIVYPCQLPDPCHTIVLGLSCAFDGSGPPLVAMEGEGADHTTSNTSLQSLDGAG